MSDTNRIGSLVSWGLMDGIWNMSYILGAFKSTSFFWKKAAASAVSGTMASTHSASLKLMVSMTTMNQFIAAGTLTTLGSFIAVYIMVLAFHGCRPANIGQLHIPARNADILRDRAGEQERFLQHHADMGTHPASHDLLPENGRITIGGVDITDMKGSWVRSHIGMVLQEPFLFMIGVRWVNMRAMAVRCFCPPDSVTPRSPTTVS